jgi:hypothetical protein
VQAGGWQADQRVAGRNAGPGDQVRALHGADDEAGDVILTGGIEARHFGGLAAEQRAAVVLAATRQPLDDLLGDVRRQAAGRQVVEEEQRHRALDENVVDAVVHQIDANAVVASGHERDLELGSDAIGTRHQDRFLPRGAKAEQAAERTNLGQDARGEGGARQSLDAAHRLVAGVDVDSR